MDGNGGDTHNATIGYTHAFGIDQPLALWKGNSLVFPHTDSRGAYTIATCPIANCVSSVYLAQEDENSFGEQTPPPNGPPNWHGSLIEGQTDASGYQYRRNRYYDPSTGRFTQEDPIGLAGGLNVYGYANGDPVHFSDPFGLCPEKPEECPGKTGALVLLGQRSKAIEKAILGGAAVTMLPTVTVLAADAGAAGGAVQGARFISRVMRSGTAGTSKLQKRLAEHIKKLEDYKANPDAYDNKGFLKNAPTQEIRERIINGRIKHLEDEIKAFQKAIDDSK